MKKNLTSVLFALLAAGSSYAQETPTMYAVHEIQVKPAANGVYRDAVKKFVATNKQQKMTYSWVAGSLDDNTYVYIIPIKGFADLDKNMFADLETKIGKDAMAGLWQSFDKCVEYQSSSVVVYLPSLSYLTPGPDDNFRNVFYWFPQAGKTAESEALVAEWVKLATAKKSPNGFQTFKTLFGGELGYVFVSWGKNKLDYETKTQKANELMGEEIGKLWEKTLPIARKFYTKVGWIENELSYAPAPN
jgi:hypothetical protein